MPALAMVREYRVYSFTATASANHVTVKIDDCCQGEICKT